MTQEEAADQYLALFDEPFTHPEDLQKRLDVIRADLPIFLTAAIIKYGKKNINYEKKSPYDCSHPTHERD